MRYTKRTKYAAGGRKTYAKKRDPEKKSVEPGESRTELLAKCSRLFLESDGRYGKIDRPTKSGVMQLVAMGSSAWNAWRSAFPGVDLDFSEIKFSAIQTIFDGYVFYGSEYSSVKFGKSAFHHVIFRNCEFGDCDFSGCEFNGKCEFAYTRFRQNAVFAKSKMKMDCIFIHCDFNGASTFEGAHFFNDVTFDYCTFRAASFRSAVFLGDSNFRYSKFGVDTSSKKVAFTRNFLDKTEASFRNAVFKKNVDFSMATFNFSADFSCSMEATEKMDPEIRNLLFLGTTVAGTISFENRRFTGKTDFGPSPKAIFHHIRNSDGEIVRTVRIHAKTRFYASANFHGCRFHQDTIFDQALFLSPASPKAARAYRTLKLAMEQLKATREEQRFFRLEMKAEHPGLPLGRRWVSALYQWCSDYGFSLSRPIITALAASAIIMMLHGLLVNSCVEQSICTIPASSHDRTSDLIKYTIISMAPVPGLDKMQTELRTSLFGQHGWIAISAVILEIFHKMVTIATTFLFALALRNLFKMKP